MANSRHSTIVSLAKTYRVQYLEMLKETFGTKFAQMEKRSLDSPTISSVKRQRSSSNSSNKVQKQNT